MNDASTDARRQPEEVARAFLTPRPPKERQALPLEDGEVLRIATSEGEVVLQRAGTGPLVLLLHGWEGQPADLAAFVAPLRRAGFGVLAMDLPAHGASAGHQMSIPQAARALVAVGKVLGPLHSAIAHSIGSAVLAEALTAGLSVRRAVLIAAPAHYERFARGFADAAGLDTRGTEAMLGWPQTMIGSDVREISLLRRAPHLVQPALFIHSSDDRVVAVEDSLASAAAWPGAHHIRVDGLGHRRILSDASVVAAAMAFVNTTPVWASP